MYKRHTGTSDNVYQKLRAQILHLELPPGSLISEIDTAEKYEVSRTPVRDAFKVLESEGLLEIKPHIGTFVSMIDLSMISDILYIRTVLEREILNDLIISFDKSQEANIRLLLKKQRELLDMELSEEELGRAFILSDNEFHDTLYKMAGKQNVMHIFRGINSQYERFRTLINREGRDSLLHLYAEHESIWEYIVSKDFEKLSACITHHICDGFYKSASIVYKYPEYFDLNDTKENHKE